MITIHKDGNGRFYFEVPSKLNSDNRAKSLKRFKTASDARRSAKTEFPMYEITK